MRQCLFASAIVIILVTLSTCSSQVTGQNATTPDKEETDDPVVARINDLEFTQSELERELAIDRAKYKLTNDKELVLQDLEGTLQGLIPSLLLEQQARQAEITATDEEVTVALSKFVAGRGVTIKALETELNHHDITLTDFRENLARNVRIEKYLDKVFGSNTGP